MFTVRQLKEDPDAVVEDLTAWAYEALSDVIDALGKGQLESIVGPVMAPFIASAIAQANVPPKAYPLLARAFRARAEQMRSAGVGDDEEQGGSNGLPSLPQGF